MFSSNYCGILIIAALSIPWSEAAVANFSQWLNKSDQSHVKVTEEAGKAVVSCAAEEVPNIDNLPELYCEETQSGQLYYQSDVRRTCRCANGYRRGSGGKCISTEDCVIVLGCPHGEIPNLDRIWQQTCDDENESWMPAQKCLCPMGKVRDFDGNCTERENCDLSIHFY